MVLSYTLDKTSFGFSGSAVILRCENVKKVTFLT